MAPTRQKKRKSTESTTSVDIQSFPAPPQMVPTKTRSPVGTPNRSPIRKARSGITLGQKQALIDNLQLEITERARKLRAQYMLQAQGLRTRVEIRVNRIPMALRRANIGELLLKYSENSSKPAPARTSPIKSHMPVKALIQQAETRASPSPHRPAKRLSDEIATDKENEDVENPKKRPRGPPQPPNRTTSRVNMQSQVLSPRSANSRTIPRSPIRPTTSPAKSQLARPISPLKAQPAISGGPASILTNMVEKAKTTRGGAATRKATETSATGGIGRGKRTAAAPAPPPKVGRGRAASDSSNTSGSTVIRKAPAPTAKKAAPATKRTVMGTIKAMGGGTTTKKAPGPKAAPAPTGGRILRKRN